MVKITIVAGIGLVVLGVVELISVFDSGSCTDGMVGRGCPPSDPFFYNISIALIVLGFVVLFFSRYEPLCHTEEGFGKNLARLTSVKISKISDNDNPDHLSVTREINF
ncbi:MAG TPA: hypothetical protein VN739_04315 [Nitrososphaerales archaeon]|nr:hypothetical protein [Nitrososphaerales archaeon]